MPVIPATWEVKAEGLFHNSLENLDCLKIKHKIRAGNAAYCSMSSITIVSNKVINVLSYLNKGQNS